MRDEHFAWRKRRCICGGPLTPAQNICPACEGAWVIRRDPMPGQLNPRPRYYTPGYGWSPDLRKAKRFATQAEAVAKNSTDDVVVPLAGECKR